MSRAEEVLAIIRERKESAEALKELLLAYFPEEYLPDQSCLMNWVTMYGLDIALEAMEETSKWYAQVEQKIQEQVEKRESEGKPGHPDMFNHLRKSKLDVIKYASATMRNILKKAENAEN